MLLEIYERRLKAPFRVEHLATTLQALLEGFDLRYRVDPEAVPDALEFDGESWSLFAKACHAIVLGFTEESPQKVGTTGKVDLGEVAREEREKTFARTHEDRRYKPPPS